jgi:hypothetical protein
LGASPILFARYLLPVAIQELNAAAEAWHTSRHLRIAEDPTPYRTKKNGTAGNE